MSYKIIDRFVFGIFIASLVSMAILVYTLGG